MLKVADLKKFYSPKAAMEIVTKLESSKGWGEDGITLIVSDPKINDRGLVSIEAVEDDGYHVMWF